MDSLFNRLGVAGMIAANDRAFCGRSTIHISASTTLVFGFPCSISRSISHARQLFTSCYVQHEIAANIAVHTGTSNRITTYIKFYFINLLSKIITGFKKEDVVDSSGALFHVDKLIQVQPHVPIDKFYEII